MSTQNGNGIAFSILPEESRQHFRLLELPPDILQLVTSDNPPLLQLKSTDNSSGNNNVVLCTPTKTYDLRQVSTSNSVFVAQSTASSEPDSLPQPQLQGIAQPQSTLEVIENTQLPAVSYIAALVPTYTSTGHYSLKDKITKQDLFANIPLSNAECEAGWREMACFELSNGSTCVVPSANVKLKAWGAMLTAATGAGIDLTGPLDQDSLNVIFDTEVEWPVELSAAVIRSMSTGESPSDGIVVDPDLCARAIGRALLKDQTNTSKGPVSLASFNARWADLLPEKWRARADLGLIEDSYRLENGDRDISFLEDSKTGTATASESTVGTKRNWHEKFRAAKKIA